MDISRWDLLDNLLYHEQSPALVASFFNPSAAFEGDLFHTIPGNDLYRITLEDLFAVTMLDMRVRPLGVRRLLHHQPTIDRATALLQEIPVDVDIWEGIDHLQPGRPADQLLRLLPREGDGIGPTTAGKILARKRARLIPIVDGVLERVVDARARDLWVVVGNYLQSAERRARLVGLRPPTLTLEVSDLRLFDIVLWMWGSQGRSTRKARLSLGLPVDCAGASLCRSI